MKHSFKNDYSELAHPEILDALKTLGTEQFEGYGLDKYCAKAAEIIKAKLSAPDADIHFVSGGTMANAAVIGSILRPCEAVIAADTGHICVHETGAIELTGHKICTAQNTNGKLQVADIESILQAHSGEHMVKPRLVFISQSTEIGSIYSKSELTAISQFCRANNLYLYLDGARLGAAMTAKNNDLTYADVARLADAFYIGGTKNGAMFGEAIVICRDELKQDFRNNLKQRGALLAKGAAMGAQFAKLFENNLHDELAKHANAMAYKLAGEIENLGFEFLLPVETNQIFPIFSNETVAKLKDKFAFYEWVRLPNNTTAVRLVTSWATSENNVDAFLEYLKKTL